MCLSLVSVGGLVHVDDAKESFSGIEYARLQISTTLRELVSRSVSIRFNRTDYEISLLEEMLNQIMGVLLSFIAGRERRRGLVGLVSGGFSKRVG